MITADPAAMRAASHTIAAETEAIAELIEDLQQAVDRLDDDWDGEAKEAYAVAQRSWLRSIRVMHRLIASLNTELDGAATSYAKLDADVASLWGR